MLEFQNVPTWTCDEFPVTSKENVDFTAISSGVTENRSIPALLCRKVLRFPSVNVSHFSYIFQVILVLASVDGSAFPNFHSNF